VYYWLVENGQLVWIGSLALAICLGGFLAWWRPRARARSRAAAARRNLGIAREDTSALNLNAVVVLRGTLECQESRQRFEDQAAVAITTMQASKVKGDTPGAQQSAVSDSVQSLAVVLGDKRVMLKGQVDLIAGSHEYHPGLKYPRLGGEIHQRVVTAAGGQPPLDLKQAFVFRSVKAGDQVHVRGCLMREQAQGQSQDLDQGAEDGGDLVLVPGASGFNAPSVLEMTCAGSPSVRGPAWMKVAFGVTVGLAVFVLLFIGGGELAYRAAASGEAEADAVGAAGGFSHALAAASPLRRRSALSSLHQALVRGRSQDLQPIIGLNQLLGQCEDSFALLMRFHRYAEAIEQRERCPNSNKPHTIAEAYLRQGRFKEASDALAAHPPPDDEPAHRMHLWAEVHLLADRPKRAAAAARRLGKVTCLTELFGATALKAQLALLGQGKCGALQQQHLLLLAEAGRPRAGRASKTEALARAELLLQPAGLGRVADLALVQAALSRLKTVQDPEPRIRSYRARVAAELAAAQLALGQGADAKQLSLRAAADLGRLKSAHLARTKLITALLAKLRYRQLRMVLSDLPRESLQWLAASEYMASNRVKGQLKRELGARARKPLPEQFQRLLASLNKKQLKQLALALPEGQRDVLKDAPRSERLKQLDAHLPAAARTKLSRRLKAGYDGLTFEPLLGFMPEAAHTRLLNSLNAKQSGWLPSKRRQQYMRLLAALKKGRNKLLLSVLPAQTRRWLLTSMRHDQHLLLLNTFLSRDALRQRMVASFEGKALKKLLLDELKSQQIKWLLHALKSDEQRKLLLASLPFKHRGPARRFLKGSWSKKLRNLAALSFAQPKRSQQYELFKKLLSTLKAREFKMLWQWIDRAEFRELPEKGLQRLLPSVEGLNERLGRYFNSDTPLVQSRQAAALAAVVELRVSGPAGARKLLTPLAEAKNKGAALIDAVVYFQQGLKTHLLVQRLRQSPLWAKDDAPGWEHVSLGSGKELAAWLRGRSDDGARFALLAAPRLRNGKDELCDWLGRGDAKICQECSLGDVVKELAGRREAARALGCKELAAAQDKISQRFVKALSNRGIALPLAALAGKIK
jgi:hypothetical protein